MLKNKKILIIVIFLLLLMLLLVGIALVKNSNNHNSDIPNSDIQRLKNYSETLTEFNSKEAISNTGYISKEDALKIIATSTINQSGTQIQMKEYLKSINSLEIELIENNENENNNSTLHTGLLRNIKSQGTYWEIILKSKSSSYIETAQFNVNYYTGEILFGRVISQINVD